MQRFIELKNCDNVKDLRVSVDSIECVFSSMNDYIGWDDKTTGNPHNFIKLKTGTIFKIKESPDDVLRIIQ